MTFPLLHDYLPRHAEVLIKAAGFTPEEKKELRRKAGVVGAGLAGLGLGAAAGLATGKAFEHVMGKPPPKTMMYAGPLLGLGSALAYKMYKKKELEELLK